MIQQNKEVVENIGVALNAIKRLRTSVGQVFSTLGNGAETESSVEDRESKILLELQEQLNVVNANLKDTETSITNLITPGGAFSLHHTALLSHETHPEKQALYPQLVHSYKWHDKLYTYSNSGSALLNQNALRRSLYTNSNKRRRPLSFNANVTSQHIHQMINAMNFSNVSFRIHSNYPTSVIVHMIVSRVVKAAIIMKGLIIEYVTVKGFDEPLDNVDDHWHESRHAVFRKIQDHAHSAMLHFFSPNLPELAIRSFITWFRSYSSLFSEPCKKCKRYLFDAYPPTWRDFRTLEAYHDECK